MTGRGLWDPGVKWWAAAHQVRVLLPVALAVTLISLVSTWSLTIQAFMKVVSLPISSLAAVIVTALLAHMVSLRSPIETVSPRRLEAWQLGVMLAFALAVGAAGAATGDGGFALRVFGFSHASVILQPRNWRVKVGGLLPAVWLVATTAVSGIFPYAPIWSVYLPWASPTVWCLPAILITVAMFKVVWEAHAA